MNTSRHYVRNEKKLQTKFVLFVRLTAGRDAWSFDAHLALQLPQRLVHRFPRRRRRRRRRRWRRRGPRPRSCATRSRPRGATALSSSIRPARRNVGHPRQPLQKLHKLFAHRHPNVRQLLHKAFRDALARRLGARAMPPRGIRCRCGSLLRENGLKKNSASLNPERRASIPDSSLSRSLKKSLRPYHSSCFGGGGAS